MKRLLFIATVLVATLASCQKEKVNAVQSVQGSEDNAIGFSTYNQKTKGSVAYIEDLQKNGFTVYGFWNKTDSSTGVPAPTTWDPTLYANFFADESGITGGESNNPQPVYYDRLSEAWTYSPIQYWPDDDLASLDFIAISPQTPRTGNWQYENAEDEGSYSHLGDFVVDADIVSQQDLLLATKFNAVQVSKVLLEFKHALSRIGFSAYTPGDEDTDIQITKIQLQHADTEDPSNPVGYFYQKGSLRFYIKTVHTSEGSIDTYQMEWTDPFDKSYGWDDAPALSFALTTDHGDFVNNGYITHDTPPERLNNEDKYIMFIPDPSGGGENLEIYIEYTVWNKDGSHSDKTKTFTCPIQQFEMGKAYTFNFNLALNEVLFDCIVIPWDESSASLNSGGNVTAKSSLEGYSVFVDAVRSSVDGKVTTAYNLYAEHGVSTETGKMMRPVWKTYNKWNSEQTGYDVPIGTLIDIYFYLYNYLIDGSYADEPDYVTMSEVTVEDTKYTCLSFSIIEKNLKMKQAFEGIYVAQYEEDPITAFAYNGLGTMKDVSVEVERAYSKWPYPTAEGVVPEPYLVDVTLSLTDSRSSKTVPFHHWEMYNKYTGEWEKIDYTTGYYSIDADNSLHFEEKTYEDGGATPVTPVFEEDEPAVKSSSLSAKAAYSGTVISLQGQYRAVYGEGTGDISISVVSSSVDVTITPAQETFEAGTTIKISAPTCDVPANFEWMVEGAGMRATAITSDARNTTFKLNGVEVKWSQLIVGSTTTEVLTFAADEALNGITFTAHYTSAKVRVNDATTEGDQNNYTVTDYAMEQTSKVVVKNITNFYNVEIMDENEEWWPINHKAFVSKFKLVTDIKYYEDGSGMEFVITRDLKRIQEALGKVKGIVLRTNNSTTMGISIDDDKGGSYVWRWVNQTDWTEITSNPFEVQAVAPFQYGSRLWIKPDPNEPTPRDFYGFTFDGLYVSPDSIAVDVMDWSPASVCDISVVYGNSFSFANQTTNSGYAVYIDQTFYKTINDGDKITLPAGPKIFLKKPSSSSVEEVYVNGKKTTYDTSYGYFLNVGTGPYDIEIKPVNGTEKLNPGGNLFD